MQTQLRLNRLISKRIQSQLRHQHQPQHQPQQHHQHSINLSRGSILIPVFKSTTTIHRLRFSTKRPPTIRAGYACETNENPKSFWRTCHNLPDIYVTPLAETPAESYTVLNDLIPHPIRYRSWGSVLEPEYRPRTQQVNNDFIPARQKFDTSKKFTEAKEEDDHLELIRQAMMTGNIRELMYALHRAPPEYPIGFGLMICSVLLYSKYSTGTIGSFDYDGWVDGHFRTVLISLDEITRFGDRIEQIEKSWDNFEETHAQLANRDIDQQSWTTRTYIWARDTLFPDNYMEASKWKQKRHAANDVVSVETLTGRSYDDLIKSTSGLSPMQEKIVLAEPAMAKVFERERQRDLELIGIEELRLRMIHDNNGSPLNPNQAYLLRNRLREVANEFSDLSDRSGLGEHQGMSEIDFEVFQRTKVKMEAAQDRHRHLHGDTHPTTGLPKPDPFRSTKEENFRIEQRQRIQDERLELLRLQRQDPNAPSTFLPRSQTDSNSSSNTSPSSRQSIDQGRESGLDLGNLGDLGGEFDENEGKSQGLFSQAGSWFFGTQAPSSVSDKSSPASALSARDLERAAKEAQKQADIEAKRLLEESDKLWKRYSSRDADPGRADMGPLDDSDDSNGSNDGFDADHALEMMKKMDMLSQGGKRGESDQLSQQLREDYRRELYGDAVPGRHQAQSTEEATDPSMGSKMRVQNPFTWLHQRDSDLATEILDKTITNTLQYRSEKDRALDKSAKYTFINEKGQSMREGYSPHPHQLESDPDYLRQRDEDELHMKRIKGGFFGGWFGGDKR